MWELLTRTLGGRLTLLLVAVLLIGLVTAAFGHFVLGAFASFGEALWSATTHMVDPGSIGDDSSAAERTIGLLQVIAGVVFFAGIVLTVLTEVIDRALRRLQTGDPALSRSGHLVIVGFNRSLEDVAARLARVLESDHPEVVVMLPPDEAGSRGAARRALAGYPARTNVVVADPESDGYYRVCAGDARHIVILSPEGDADRADLEATSRAMLLKDHLFSMGPVVPGVAVEIRRVRNAEAFWLEHGTDPEGSTSRFPDYFDALVNDRNIGALLGLMVANPIFADTFSDDDGSIAPDLIPVGACAGMSFGEARRTIGQVTLLGILTGTGHRARAHYLPDDQHALTDGDRLIVIQGAIPSAGSEPDVDPRSVKVAPATPRPLLMIGWSDASRALVEDLEAGGSGYHRLHLLNPERPRGFTDSHGRGRFELIEGDPSEPADITDAIRRAEPGTILVAVCDGDEPGALVSGMLARKVTEVPILVEQSSTGHRGQTRRIATGVTIVSTSEMLADTVALSLADPSIQVAREEMLNDPEIALESLTYTGQQPLPLGELPTIFGRAGSAPLAVCLSDEEDTVLRPGDHILALRRIEEHRPTPS